MNLLPYEHLTYLSPLTNYELKERMMEYIEPKKTFRIGFKNKGTKAYEGGIDGDTFKINRIIDYRNSFLPIITGYIQETPNGSRIEVKMRLSVYVYVFLTFWCGFVGIAFLVTLVSSINNRKFEPGILGLLFMLLFAYFLTFGAFKFESGTSKRDLEKILNGKTENLLPSVNRNF